VNGLRLVAATYSNLDGPCETAVTWKRISIQAEQLTDLP
jgi:hypothetical protein